jgi:hypothetical protein
MRVRIVGSAPECWYHGMNNQQFSVTEASEYERKLRIDSPPLASEYYAIDTGDEQGLYIRKRHCSIVNESREMATAKIMLAS